ncbi:hypothetical protein J7432_21660 [Xanthomonas axonopodis pv. begoniae]|nr:hypothetical protein [Xanthomonas axonopodis pv. begoniae]MBO9770954.1 hypothetical protein [Xanthomonas axonopodis pv. begoniae]
MISRVLLKCLTCSKTITARIQVGHEEDQLISSVCPHCFTPFRLKLWLDNPPHVRVEFTENCKDTDMEGEVLNIGSGFIISREKSRLDKYFPSFDLPRPSEEEYADQVGLPLLGENGPVMLDISIALGGLPKAKQVWRITYNAYQLSRLGNFQQALTLMRQNFEMPNEMSVRQVIMNFLARVLAPNGQPTFTALMKVLARVREINDSEYHKLLEDFLPKWEDRMDQKMEVFDSFFRAYDEFNQAFLYVRRGITLPDNPYAPSTDFEHTRMYYGDAFEVFGSHIDLLAAFNNILLGRSFDQLELISLERYRGMDRGARNKTFAANPELAWLVEEYDNRLRNSSHHRWLRLSTDRSELSYREGGSGQLVRLSYAEYLFRCCAMTRQLMLLALVEWLVFADWEE